MEQYAVYVLIVADTEDTDLELSGIAVDIERLRGGMDYAEARKLADAAEDARVWRDVP